MNKPITGKEKFSDNSCLNALIEFYRAFNQGDMELMRRNWSQSSDIAMDNPLGDIKRGWEEVQSVYENIFIGQAKVYVEFYDYSVHETPNMFYTVGRERGHFILGVQQINLEIRTSRIYKMENNFWKQVHHHGSIESPELLKSYQSLVRK